MLSANSVFGSRCDNHTKHSGRLHLTIVADQFEELYTECKDESLRQAFIAALLALAKEKDVAVLLTLRADFYGHVLADCALGETVGTGQLNVSPMSETELQLAVEEPALSTGRGFEAGLVARILEDVTQQPGSLPLRPSGSGWRSAWVVPPPAWWSPGGLLAWNADGA